MNKLYVPFLILLSSCLGYKELPVEYDYSYRGNFKKYRTFDIMRPVGMVDSSMNNTVIEKSIIDSLTFNGYNQPDIEEWMKAQREDIDYSRQKYNLKSGTLLIQFFDRRQNRSIWQGYATTLYGSIDFNNQRHLRNAVISILDKYRFWAEGFVEGSPNEETDL